MRGCFFDAGSLGDDLDWSTLEHTLDEWRLHHNTAPDERAARIAGFEVVITNKIVLDADTIAAADSLQLICAAATGVNNIDLDAAAGHGIPVVNVPGYSTPAVAQHVLALMLAHATRWTDYATDVRAGAWSDSPFFCRLDYPIEELQSQTLGLVGYGTLGRAVAQLARAFGMRILIAERPGIDRPREGRITLEAMLAEADYVSLHCPLTADTGRLIDADALARMPAHAFLINTARGGLVDDAALIAALQTRRIAGAAVDVLDREPPPADHPLLTAGLPNLIVTPHSAWASRGARQRVLDGVAENIVAFRAGRIRNRVD